MVIGEVTLYQLRHLNSSLSRLQQLLRNRIWGKSLRYGSSNLFEHAVAITLIFTLSGLLSGILSLSSGLY